MALPPGEPVVGRRAGADVQLNNPSVAWRASARAHRQPPLAVGVDSQNGIWADGTRMKPTKLERGDAFRVGRKTAIYPARLTRSFRTG